MGTMDGKVCVVTGANTGIGKATAAGLARLGATVVMACRDVAKGEAARAEVAAETGSDTLRVMRLDLGSTASVREFVTEFERGYDRLDALVNNAALSPLARSVNDEGRETQLAVNHLGPFLLTRLLLPRLRASAPSRVVVVSSAVHKQGRVDFDDLHSERGYVGLRVYANTKLMNLLFTRALARRLEGTGVTVNALHPGVVATELVRDFPKAARWFVSRVFMTPEKGARTSVFLASDPSVEGVSGRYYVKSREARVSAAARDDAMAERLWALSSEMVGMEA
ncbi:MAG: SDR family oxidoreductase [Polyangiales bacterium]